MVTALFLWWSAERNEPLSVSAARAPEPEGLLSKADQNAPAAVSGTPRVGRAVAQIAVDGAVGEAAAEPLERLCSGSVTLTGIGWPARLAGMTIRLRHEDGGDEVELRLDEGGRWTQSLRCGAWTVGAHALGADWSLGVDPKSLQVEPEPGRGSAYELRVSRCLLGRGRVEDCRGNPLSGVEVRVPGSPLGVTNTAGEFELPFDLDRGPATIYVEPESLEPPFLPPWWQRSKPWSLAGPYPALSLEKVAVLVLPRAARVRGRVTLASGESTVGLALSLRGRFGPDGTIGGPNHVLMLTNEGTFAMDGASPGSAVGLAPGSYEARLYGTGAGHGRPGVIPFQVGCQEALVLDLNFRSEGDACLAVQLDVHGTGRRTQAQFGVWDRADFERDGHAAFARGVLETDSTGIGQLCGLAVGDYVTARTSRRVTFGLPGALDPAASMAFSVTEAGQVVHVTWALYESRATPLTLRTSPELGRSLWARGARSVRFYYPCGSAGEAELRLPIRNFEDFLNSGEPFESYVPSGTARLDVVERHADGGDGDGRVLYSQDIEVAEGERTTLELGP